WYVPDTANEGNNWLGNLKIPVNQITTKPLGGGWYFCEGYYNLVPDESGLFDLWTVAAGFEGSEAFKIQISN
ncbi:hypothetical protein, partial [Bacillus subtilis]